MKELRSWFQSKKKSFRFAILVWKEARNHSDDCDVTLAFAVYKVLISHILHLHLKTFQMMLISCFKADMMVLMSPHTTS